MPLFILCSGERLCLDSDDINKGSCSIWLVFKAMGLDKATPEKKRLERKEEELRGEERGGEKKKREGSGRGGGGGKKGKERLARTKP